jgi:hypothetical protein
VSYLARGRKTLEKREKGGHLPPFSRFKGLSEVIIGIDRGIPWDLTSCRRLAIESAKVRRVNVEGSTVQLNQRKVPAQSKESASTIEGRVL